VNLRLGALLCSVPGLSLDPPGADSRTAAERAFDSTRSDLDFAIYLARAAISLAEEHGADPRHTFPMRKLLETLTTPR
jgi:hypothetical protein